MDSATVDVTSLVAIESRHRGKQSDPWAARLAGNLADLFVYSDEVRYPLPTSIGDSARSDLAILGKLRDRDSAAVLPLPYSTDTVEYVAEEHLEDCLAQFAGWCSANPNKASTWMNLHQEQWINQWHNDRFPHLYSFDIHRFATRDDVRLQAQRLGVPVPILLYTLDVILRYPMLGRLSGEHRPYLNHPIRETITHSTMSDEPELTQTPLGTLSFSKTVESMFPSLTLDEYTVLIHELRGTVRELGIHRSKPGAIEKEVVRELASRVALPARLGNAERRLAFGAGLIGGIASSPVLGYAGPILGIGVSIAQHYWHGTFPRPVSRVRWLRWALAWDIESQAED